MSIPAATRRDLFGQAAAWTARASGTRWAFGGAVGVIASWALLGPLFHYSETWQLVINTGTTIVTFLMVFLIQNAQNRESKAIHLKLDELIRSTQQADNAMIDVEGLSEAQLDALGRHYHRSGSSGSSGRSPRISGRHEQGDAGRSSETGPARRRGGPSTFQPASQ